MSEPQPLPEEGGKQPAGAASGPRTITSQDLMRGQREVLIAHGSETYRLRLTRSGKLILQK